MKPYAHHISSKEPDDMNPAPQARPAATPAAPAPAPVAPAAAAKVSAKPTKPAAEPAVRVLKPIHGSKMRLAQFRRQMWSVVAPDDMTVEEMENPVVWMHTSREWQMHDRVEVCQSRRWTEGLVIDTGTACATIKVLHSFELPAPRFGQEKALPPGYSIRQGKPDESPFVVIRDSDGWQMNKNSRHTTFEEARRYLLDMAIFRT